MGGWRTASCRMLLSACAIQLASHPSPPPPPPLRSCIRYNHSIPEELGARIPVRGAAGQNALCVLVANSRALWEPFVEACANDDLLQHDNPLETYLQQHVCSALAAHAPG